MTRDEYEAKRLETAKAIYGAYWEGSQDWDDEDDEDQQGWINVAEIAMRVNGITPPESRWETGAERIVNAINGGLRADTAIAAALKAEAERVRGRIVAELEGDGRDTAAKFVRNLDLSK